MAQVKVEWPVHGVEVTPSTVSLSVGGTVQLGATLRAENGTVLTNRTVSWSSGSP